MTLRPFNSLVVSDILVVTSFSRVFVTSKIVDINDLNQPIPDARNQILVLVSVLPIKLCIMLKS